MYDGATFEVSPRLVQPPFTQISNLDGLGYLLPTERQDGSICLALALSDPLWALLLEDEALAQYLDSSGQ